MVDIKAELPSSPDHSIRGEIVLGLKDPRVMSKEEFNLSSDLLYHGAAKDFIYSPAGEFDPEETGGDGTHDYGEGFYMTDNSGQASNYSIVRAAQLLERPIVYSFMPFQAKMLDVRSTDDPSGNGKLPRNFVEDWLRYLENFVNNKDNFSRYNEFLKDTLRGGINDYFLNRVKKAVEENKSINIRGGNNIDNAGIFQREGNGLISHIFKDFMLSKGYDGMIYREGGEGEAREPLTGYVFYNPRVVDTFEGWQKRIEAA